MTLVRQVFVKTRWLAQVNCSQLFQSNSKYKRLIFQNGKPLDSCLERAHSSDSMWCTEKICLDYCRIHIHIGRPENLKWEMSRFSDETRSNIIKLNWKFKIKVFFEKFFLLYVPHLHKINLKVSFAGCAADISEPPPTVLVLENLFCRQKIWGCNKNGFLNRNWNKM